jgi:hypothetical protein
VISIQEYEAMLKRTEAEVQEWRERFHRMSEVSLRRADLLHRVVEAVKGHSVEDGTYDEKNIPSMVRQEIADAAAAVGRPR